MSGASILERLVRASIEGGAFVLAVAVICRLATRLSARDRAALWWLAAAKLLVALIPIAPLVLPVLPPKPATVTRDAAVAKVYALPAAAPSPRTIVIDPAPSAGRSLDPAPAWAIAWAAGVGLLLATSLPGAMRARMWRRAGRRASDPAIVSAAAAAARAAGLRRSPEVRVVAGLPGPLVVGFVRPAVLLPDDATERMTAAELAMALEHEMTHVARWDLWLGLVPAAARRVFFFHPLAWIAEREYAVAREAACDEEVVSRAGADAAAYGRLLLRLCARRTTAAATLSTRSMLRRRLEMIESVVRRHPLGRRAAWALLAVASVAFVPVRLVAREAPAPPAPPTPPAVEASPAPPAEPGTPAPVIEATAPIPPPRAIAVAAPSPAPAPPPRAVAFAVAPSAPLPPPRTVAIGATSYAAAPTPRAKAYGVGVAASAPGATAYGAGPASAPRATSAGAGPAVAPRWAVAVGAGPAMAQAALPPDAAEAGAPVPPTPAMAPRARVALDVENDDSRCLGAGKADAYVIVRGDNHTMCGNMADLRAADKLRNGNEDLIWYRVNGQTYVIRDKATVDSALAAFDSSHDLSKLQQEIGRVQEGLAKRQEELARQQSTMDQAQATIDDRRAAMAQAQTESQRAEAELKVAAIEKQISKLDAMMQSLDQNMDKLGEAQESLSRQMAERDANARRKLAAILEEAAAKGSAQRAP